MKNSGIMYGGEYDFEERSREDDYYGIEDFQFFPDSEEKENDLMEGAVVSEEEEALLEESKDRNSVEKDNDAIRTIEKPVDDFRERKGKAIAKYERYAKKNGYEPKSLSLEDRDEIWEKIKGKKWAYVQKSTDAAGNSKSNNSQTTFYRVDELQYAELITNDGMAYQSVVPMPDITINMTWIPENTLDPHIGAPGAPSGAIYQENINSDLTNLLPSDRTFVSAQIRIIRSDGNANPEQVILNGISQTLDINQSFSADLNDPNVTIGVNRTDAGNPTNALGNALDGTTGSWAWYKISINITNNKVRKITIGGPYLNSNGNTKKDFIKDVLSNTIKMTPWVQR